MATNRKKTSPIAFEQVLQLIQEARNRVYTKANSELIVLYFNVGKLVSDKVDSGNWGDGTVQELADFIQQKMPNLSGFNRRGLYRMKQFYEVYADKDFFSLLTMHLENTVLPQKVSTVLTQLKNTDHKEEVFVTTVLAQIQWSAHLHILSKVKTAEERLFYLLLVIKEQLSVRELERQINAATFERTMLSNQRAVSINSLLPTNFFKDPYIFEFLDLPELHSEQDLETALVYNLQNFILEIGKGFTYMGRQYRLQVGNKDFYTDLLFYHRDLQCLVLFELKIQDFEPEFLGKLNFYLEALDRDVKRPTENPSIGILLCKGKDTEVVEYAMARNTSPAMIAEYQTKLIDKNILKEKLSQLAQILKIKEHD